jgi:adenylyl-sulfate kinase
MDVGKDAQNLNITRHEDPVTYEDRCRILGQRGAVIWLTGLSGSGKSTLADLISSDLASRKKCAYILDGDNMRHGLCAGLGFSDGDRSENIRRIAETAALFCDAGIIAIVSVISPRKAMRDDARRIIGDAHFYEIYVKADADLCAKRDPKGLYRKAKDGSIREFTGISSPYEEPEDPDLLVDTTEMTPEETAKSILDFIVPEVTL